MENIINFYKNSEYDMSSPDEDIEKIDKDKIEYPDLYIPLMSFITYILLVAFNTAYTQGKELNPDILGMKSTKNFSILLLHTILLKGIFYIFCNFSVALLDLLSYISYKFVTINILTIFWIFSKNTTIYYVSLIFTMFLSMIFMQKVFLNRISTKSEMHAHQKLIVYLVSCLEILTILLITLDLI